MIKKIFIGILILIIAVNTVNAIDTSNWSEVTVGYENFSIPPNYSNPYQSNFNMYQYGEDIDEFTIRFVYPNIMDLYGYFIQQNSFCKKLKYQDMMQYISSDMTDRTIQTTRNFGFLQEKNSTILHGEEKISLQQSKK